MSADASRLRDRLISWSHEVVAGTLSDAVPGIAADAPFEEAGSIRDAVAVEEVIGTASGGSGTIAARVQQARWTDEGTDPHEIWAHNESKVLRFKSGAFVSTKNKPVMHPGNTAQRWWGDSFRWNVGEALRRRASSTRV